MTHLHQSLPVDHRVLEVPWVLEVPLAQEDPFLLFPLEYHEALPLPPLLPVRKTHPHWRYPG